MSVAALLVLVLLAIVVALLVAVAVVRFETRCLGELADTSDTDLLYLSRRGWFLLIACWIPFGGVFFLCCGRRR